MSTSSDYKRSPFSVLKKANYTVHPDPYAADVPGFREFSLWGFRAAFLAFPLIPMMMFGSLTVSSYSFWFLLSAIPVYVAYMWTDSIVKDWYYAQSVKHAGLKITDFMEFKTENLKRKYKGKARIPMETFFELYFDGKIDIKGDMLDLLENRANWASFRFTLGHMRFLVKNFVPEVREHYDRGNDFYEAFLGPRMVYTSGIINKPEERETLEELQDNKLKLVCEKVQLKKGEKMLDIGCGWGTLAAFAAKHYGADVTAVTLAREQVEFGNARAKEWGVPDKVKFLCHDYRDIPKSTDSDGTKYNKITCLEMAEHVGVLKFNAFLRQVDELLQDDGIFYMQVAGLRRPWQYEDLIWGLFMNKYVFPGADASTPLFWYVNQLEYAGFEVMSVDTVGVHYSATLERWYQNWMKPENRELITNKYGDRAWRVWEFFLAYSTIVARQGSATCYQIVAHKNSNKFNRAALINGYQLDRLKTNKQL